MHGPPPSLWQRFRRAPFIELRWQLDLALWEIAGCLMLARALLITARNRLWVRLSWSKCEHCGGGGREIDYSYDSSGNAELHGSRRCRCCEVWANL